MALIRKPSPPKGSTVIIVFMYATWCAYIAVQIWCKTAVNAYLPAEVTYGTAALFIVETVSLARLKMAKEGAEIPARKLNAFASKLGISGLEDFEEEVKAAQAAGKDSQ